MIRRIIALAVTFALAAAPAAFATHPEEDPDDCRGTIGGAYVKHTAPQVQIPVVTNSVIIPLNDRARGPFYLDIRELMSAYWTFSLWLYQETNGVAGMQRGGRSIVPDTPGTTGVERCIESATPDQAIF